MSRLAFRPWLALVLTTLAACSSKDVAPALAHCAPQSCNPNPIVAGGGVGGSGGADSGINPVAADLDVHVVGFTDNGIDAAAWSTSNAQDLNGTFAVQFSAADGTVTKVSGSNPIAVVNALASGIGWVMATPEANSGHYPGITGIASDAAVSISVPLLRVNDFDFVPTLLSTKVLNVDLTKAQIVLKIVDGSGYGVSGLRVYDIGSDALAYDNLGNWLDASTGATTDVSGRVVAINLPASDTFVRSVNVYAYGPDLQGVTQTVYTQLPILAGFVTYSTLTFN
jgi:hypothetical protein